MKNILEIDSVIKFYGERQVLSDIYMKCETGDIIGMLGRNGSGKSTLLKILFGCISSDNKFVRINGKVYKHPYKHQGLISYLPQHSFLLQHLKVHQTIRLYINEQIQSFFNDPIIDRIKNNKINTLSGGELRYLEIKLLLHTNSKFILLDEPFNSVAPIIVELLKNMITEHSKTKGIILTDHDYNNVMEVANKYCLIYDGGIKKIDNKEDLINWQYITINSL